VNRIGKQAATDKMTAKKTFLNERLTYKLNLLAQEAIEANDNIFLRETGYRIRELRVLRLIDDMPGTTFREIATVTGLERSLTSRIIQSLIAGGMIERENSGEDARVFRLKTTENGKRIRMIGRQVSDRLEAILTMPLTGEELGAFNSLLARLAEWVSSNDYHMRLKSSESNLEDAS
jgi:DNA-binding MarR family transcriptional regulator